MQARSLRLALVLLLIAALALIWILQGAQRDGEADAGAGAAAAPAAGSGLAESQTEAGALQREDAEGTGGATDAARLGSQPAGTIDRDRDLHGIVLGPDGKAFAGATVTVQLPARQGQGGLDLALTYASQQVAQLASAADGSFSIPVEPGRRYDLDVRAPGFVAPLLRGCQAGERVEVRLQAAGTLRGRVLEADGSTPVAGAGLRLFGYGGSGQQIPGRSDEAGEFFYDNLALHDWRLEVEAAGWPEQDWHTIVIQPGGECRYDVVLSAGPILRGRVVDAATGQPIAGAEVSPSWVFKPVVRSGADGSFALPVRTPGAWSWEYHARAPGYGRRAWEREGELPAEPVLLELTTGHRLSGRITGAGQALPGAYVAAVASMGTDQGQQIDWLATRTGADGRFQIEDLRPDVPHALQIRHPGFGGVIYELPPEESNLPSLDLGTIDLAPASNLAGRAVDETGNPLPGLSLRLEGTNADRARWSPQKQHGLSFYVEQLEARTDDLGRFRFTDLAAGSYSLHAMRQSLKIGEPLGISVGAGATVAGLELLVATGLSISGQVFDPDGQALAGVRVYAFSERSREVPSLKPTDAGGAFLIPGLPAGDYRIHFQPPRNWDAPLQPGAVCEQELAGIAAGSANLRVQLPWLSGIRGTVFDAAGAPALAFVSALAADGQSVSMAASKPDGTFLLLLPAGTSVDLVAQPRSDLEGSRNVSDESAQARLSGVTAGATDLVLRLPRVP